MEVSRPRGAGEGVESWRGEVNRTRAGPQRILSWGFYKPGRGMADEQFIPALMKAVIDVILEFLVRLVPAVAQHLGNR